jgi:hypothetical protein
MQYLSDCYYSALPDISKYNQDEGICSPLNAQPLVLPMFRLSSAGSSHAPSRADNLAKRKTVDEDCQLLENNIKRVRITTTPGELR